MVFSKLWLSELTADCFEVAFSPNTVKIPVLESSLNRTQSEFCSHWDSGIKATSSQSVSRDKQSELVLISSLETWTEEMVVETSTSPDPWPGRLRLAGLRSCPLLNPCQMPGDTELGDGCACKQRTADLSVEAAEELWDWAWNFVLELLLGTTWASAEESVQVVCCSSVCTLEFIWIPAIRFCFFSASGFVSQVPSVDVSGLLLVPRGVLSVKFIVSVLEIKLLFESA